MHLFLPMYISINIVTIFNVIFFRDYSDILNAESLDLVSPWLAFDHVEAFPIVKSFLTHLLIHYKFEEFIQIPTNALIVTIPRLFEFFWVRFFNWYLRSLIIQTRLKILIRYFRVPSDIYLFRIIHLNKGLFPS